MKPMTIEQAISHVEDLALLAFARFVTPTYLTTGGVEKPRTRTMKVEAAAEMNAYAGLLSDITGMMSDHLAHERVVEIGKARGVLRLVGTKPIESTLGPNPVLYDVTQEYADKHPRTEES